MPQTPDVIKADAKTVRELLDKIKYEIDVFQREYAWGRSQIEYLISDLESKFSAEYQEGDERKDVQNYARYYMGSIIVSTKEGKRSIIDGQQRLTSMTLLLIYLNNLQKEKEKQVVIDELIFSEKYDQRSYNIDIPNRTECMDALYTGKIFDSSEKGESVKNIMQRYDDIIELFPDELKDIKLPFFIDWLIDNVMFVEIKTSSDDDAYTIFETMNDRGLNLTSSEMLKGYLLSNIDTEGRKIEANDLWKEKIVKIKEIKKEEDLEFFKSWFRGKYAKSIRSGKKDSENKDFEKIGTRFHNWVRENKEELGLVDKSSFYNFIKNEFDFYSKSYLKINHASNNLQKGLEHIFYIEKFGVASSFYYPMLISPISINDDEETINKKMNLVARFLEIFHVFRKINYRTTSYSAIRYTIFSIIMEIRNKSLEELVIILKEKTSNLDENLDGIQNYGLASQNKKIVHYLLARITNHIEIKSAMESSFENYISKDIEKPYEIEHLWANKIEYHSDEFTDNQEFDNWRNSLGALILVPSGFNQSYNAEKYEIKLPHYLSQNLLARSLNSQCYEKNPSFSQYVEKSGLQFKSHTQFKKEDITTRQSLYQKICEEIWNISGFDEIAS
jgi:uncharacterized protein with ParB-like and HNH nuclease domain